MNKADITPHLVVRAKNPELTNYQIEINKHKSVYTFAKVLSVKTHYEGGKNVTYIYFVGFNYWGSKGLVSCRKLTEFKREFKHLKFNK